MKKLLFLPLAAALLAGCATGYEKPRAVMTPTGEVVYEAAGAERDPNPNWDMNARDIWQRPYGNTVVPYWQPATSAVHTSTDVDKNIAPGIRNENQLPGAVY